MFELKISITGITKLQADLTNIMDRVKINNLLEDAAIIVEGEAKRICPVDTGTMQKNIIHYESRPYEQTIIANVPYSDYIEYGTIHIPVGTSEQPYIYTSTSGKYPSYRPFLRSALYQNMNRINEMFNKALSMKET